MQVTEKPLRQLSHLTDCGIPGIEKIPYGIHLCHFYRNREELVDALLPYFEAGIRNHERCLWIAADPLPAGEAQREFIRRYPALEDALKGQLTIIDPADCFADGSGIPVLESWLREERAALSEGHRGLRITGNTSFVTPAVRQAFMEYEHSLTEAIGASRIIALCSYASACTMAEAADVMCAHQFTLERQREFWQLREALPSAGY